MQGPHPSWSCHCRIHHEDNTLIAKSAETPRHLYFLSITNGSTDMMPNSSTTLTTTISFDLAHKQLAHPGRDTLQLMIHKKLIDGLDNIPSNPEDFDCKSCICGKMTTAPFQKGHDTASKQLGHLHSDVGELMDIISLAKKCYFCILVDDKTGYTWFSPCTQKSDFTDWFIKLDKLFMNHYGTHVKILWSNHGVEYVNLALEKRCTESRIKLNFTIPHTPEQN